MASPAQMQMLEAIDAFIKRFGYSPSFEELMAARGVLAKSGVSRLVHLLKDQGFVDFIPQHARTLVLTADGMEALMGYRKATGMAELNERVRRMAEWAAQELTAPAEVRDDARAVLKTLSDGGLT